MCLALVILSLSASAVSKSDVNGDGEVTIVT